MLRNRGMHRELCVNTRGGGRFSPLEGDSHFNCEKKTSVGSLQRLPASSPACCCRAGNLNLGSALDCCYG